MHSKSQKIQRKILVKESSYESSSEAHAPKRNQRIDKGVSEFG
jgi:hypothetical protein